MRFSTIIIAAFAAVATATSNIDDLSENDLNEAFDLINRYDPSTKTLLPTRDIDAANKGGGGGGKGGGGKGKGGKGGGGGATSKCTACQNCLSNCDGLEGPFATSGCTLGCSTSKTCKGC